MRESLGGWWSLGHWVIRSSEVRSEATKPPTTGYPLGGGLILTLLLLLLPCLPLHADPDDIVPRGHIAYDLMGSLAVAGRLPGYTLRDFARGDRLYTRAEIARILAQAGKETSKPNDTYASAERTLRILFASELKRYGLEPFANSAMPAETALLTGQLKVRGLTNPAAGEGIVRAAVAMPLGRDGVVGVSAGNGRREWYSGRFSNVETAFARINGRVFDVTVGQSPLRWGPGFSGGLLFSDESTGVPRIEVEKEFQIKGIIGKRTGRLRYTQFYGQFFDPDVPNAASNARGTQRHLAGRRLETVTDGRFSLSLAESLKSTRLPDPLWSFVLPFYVYQNDWTKNSGTKFFGFLATDKQPNTFWLNYVANIALTYRADARGTRLYTDILLDDLKAPTGLGLGDNTPRRMGFLYGVNMPNIGGTGRYGIRLEYATIDRDAYFNVSDPINWDQDDRSLGYPTGPNARHLFARLDANTGGRLRLAAEAAIRRRAVIIPDRPTPNADRFSLFATYAPRRDLFFGLRLERLSTTPASQPTIRKSRIELNAGMGF